MEFGAVFPTCEIGNDPAAIRDFAQTAEGLGYSHLIAYDHVLSAEHADREPPLGGPYTEKDPFHEPFTLFGYLAAVTERIELTTGVIILPQRQTALVAKQAAELALLSQGRFRLGVGTGWNWVEYEGLGESWSDRAPRFEEQIEVLRRLWSEPLLDYAGRFHRIDRAGIAPLPPHPIPIWIGGMTAPAIRRAARIADGFLAAATHPFMLDGVKTLWEELEAAGRDRADFGLETIEAFGHGPDHWRQSLEDWRAVGATHFSMRAMSTGTGFAGEPDPGFTKPSEHIAALESFIRELR